MLSSSSQLRSTSCTHSRSSSKPRRGMLLVTAAVKAKSARQVACSKTLVSKPEHTEEVQQLCQQAMEFSQKQMGNRSSGIQEFTCSADGWVSNVFHFWERYDSNVSLGKHNTTPEMEQFMNKVVPLLEKPVGMALYEYRDGQLGPPSMQSGPKGEGGLDDATGASGAAGGASYKQTSTAAQLQSLADEEEPTAGATSSSKQQAGSAAGGEAWGAAASQPAVLAGILAAAALVVFAGLRLTGH
eukprot:GHRQ01007372.1.p1 GENE.GHRQ01007372.1~~GHRQ01007372.1.p1  ORF type:complete len:242 (+),score=81.25 GHRQ01007372.1:210-935(+)